MKSSLAGSELDESNVVIQVDTGVSEPIFALNNVNIIDEESKPLKMPSTERKENDQALSNFLVKNGFQYSSDGIVSISQGDVETAVQLLLTSGIAGINEVNAYSKLKASKQIVIV